MYNYNTLGDSIGENLDCLGYGKYFLDTKAEAWSMKEIIEKLELLKVKNFCSVKDHAKRIRWQKTHWEKYIYRRHM